MRELRHWPSIAGMLPQSHCGDEEDGRIGFSSWLYYIYEDDDSLNLQNVKISNKAIEKEKIREGVETSKQNGVDINLSSIWSQLLQDDKDLNSKFTSSASMLTMDSSSEMNHSDFHASEVKDEIFNTQDREFLSVLENLMDIDDPLHSQNKNVNAKVTTEGRISVTFVQTLCLT